MALPVLVTKLYRPVPRAGLVSRRRLAALLDAGRDRALTIVRAPAGFGKTTLVSAWLADDPRPVAWISLDEGDNDPDRFLACLVAAFQTVAPNLGAELRVSLGSGQSPPLDVALTWLLNDLAALPAEVVLVLDDYHLITAVPVHRAVGFMLDHRPPGLRLVITTRAEPPLPLARLRARHQLTEVSAAALRFTVDEATLFLTTSMGLDLAATDVAALTERTEGWVAGLHLAALALQGHDDAPTLIRAFRGDHRYIADYLVAEVLAQQPEPVRDFLLTTSILDRLHGPLCDAISGQVGGRAQLQALERENHFVVPLDETGQWFRYHHLFADVLRARLLVDRPEQIATLHRRASRWFEERGATPDAVRHALAAGDAARAAGLIELAIPTLRVSRQDRLVRGWLAALPEELIRLRPVLSVASAWTLLAAGELAAVEPRLRDAERWLAITGNAANEPRARSAAMVVVDEEEFRRLPGIIALYRAGCAQIAGDLPATARHARRVLDVASADDRLLRGGAAALLGLASWASGDLETAHRAYAAGMDDVLIAGNLSDVLSSAIALADIRIAQGRLHDAQRTYDRALRLADEQGAPVLRGTADLYVGLSELHRERNDLHAATRALLRGEELGERSGMPYDRARWCLAMARLREVEGDPERARALLAEAERQFAPWFFPDARPVAAWQARMWIVQGRLGEARAWARERELAVTDDLTYLREFEHMTLARLMLAEYRRDRDAAALRQVLDFLERLLSVAGAGGRTGSAIEILILRALAHQAAGDVPAALIPLRRALTLAGPEGYVRTFVDEGEPMALLLRAAAARDIMPVYAGALLGAFGIEPSAGAAEPPLSDPAAAQFLVEPLSRRELDVLRLFATDLSGPEIADELVVALSTVRTHTKRIYGKLNVTNRRAAVTRAAELRLI